MDQAPQTQTQPALAQKAWEMAPFFAAQAARNEAAGRLSDATLAALRDGGFLAMWMPRHFGGVEAGPVESLKTVEALSYADGSTGWVLMAAQVAMGTAAAYLQPSAAAEIFTGRLPIIAGQGAANGRADVEGKGFRLSGRWFYGSGLLHSEYLHTGGVVHENGAPRLLPGTTIPDVRIFIVPIGAVQFLGNWDVLGLRATGSVDYALTDVFVPEEFTHRQQTKTPLQGGNIYRLGITQMGGIGHTGFALGIGRRMLDELAALARAESGRPMPLAEPGGGESFREQFGAAEATYRAARAFAFEVWSDIEATLQRGDGLATRQSTLLRLALNHATSAVAEVCSFAYRYGGGVALHNGVMQRCFRDMHAGTQHVTTGPSILRECARELLGVAPGKVWSARALVDPE